MNRKGFLVFSHACFLAMLSAMLLGLRLLRDAPWELPLPKASNAALTKSDMRAPLCGKGDARIHYHKFPCSLDWNFPSPRHKDHKGLVRDAFW